MVYWLYETETGLYDWQVQKALEEERMPKYTILDNTEWEQLAYFARRDGKDIANDPKTNRPMLVERHPLGEDYECKLEDERFGLLEWLKSKDYIGIKIATGRATIEEYADIIAEMESKASRVHEIDDILSTRSCHNVH